MGRAVVTAPTGSAVRQAFPDVVDELRPGAQDAPRQQEPFDTYRDRLFKYIPAEVVTLYLGLMAILGAAKEPPYFLPWVAFLVGLVGTPFYLRSYQKVMAPTQLIVSTAAFAVWVFALGGPFTALPWYKQVYGAVLLPIFTFFVAGISPRSR